MANWQIFNFCIRLISSTSRKLLMQEEFLCPGNNALYLKNNVLTPKLPDFINETRTLLASPPCAWLLRAYCPVPNLS
jgi:hypothetical protein